MAEDLEKMLTDYLKSITTVTDLVGTGDNAKIFLHEPKQGQNPPYIVFEIFDGTSAEDLQGAAGIASNRVQIDCYSLDKRQAYTLAERVRLNLQGHRGPIGNGFFNGVTSDQGYERGYDKPSAGANTKRFYVSRDYTIHHTEAT